MTASRAPYQYLRGLKVCKDRKRISPLLLLRRNSNPQHPDLGVLLSTTRKRCLLKSLFGLKQNGIEYKQVTVEP